MNCPKCGGPMRTDLIGAIFARSAVEAEGVCFRWNDAAREMFTCCQPGTRTPQWMEQRGTEVNWDSGVDVPKEVP